VKLDCRGAQNFPLIVIFGVFIAFMVTFIFISIYGQQANARVEEAARSLSEDLARTAFLSVSSGQLTPYDLPEGLAGSSYTVDVLDNSAFQVNVTDGRMSGNIYSSVVNATLTVDGTLISGNRIYFFWVGGRVIVSDTPVEVAAENVAATPSTNPPPFYSFSKEKPQEAAGIIASYFHIRGTENASDWDVQAYRWEGENLITQATATGKSATMRASGTENGTSVGKVENFWIVTGVENTENSGTFTPCDSVENAYGDGWLYSPDMVLEHLRSRSWRRTHDNVIVSIPSFVDINAAAVTTNISTYPAWRVTFENQVIFYRAMSWWELDNTPGFLFQSSPELYPII